MTQINVNYGAMAAGFDGLVATWGRIESHLAELDAAIAATTDMTSEALASYMALKARWDGAAEERQIVLKTLADGVDNAATAYRQADAAAAAMFAI